MVAVLVGALAIGLGAAALAHRRVRSCWTQVLVAVTAGGIGFQVLHLVEHLSQVGYWVAHPTAAPWLTPWAGAGVDLLARLTDGQPGSGTELLHLVGNGIFLAGLAGAVLLARAQQPDDAPRLLRLALWVQAAHVAEHLVLTVTWFATGRSLGATTAFGALTDAPLFATRVWAHYAINLVATGLALRGLGAVAPPGRAQRRVGTTATKPPRGSPPRPARPRCRSAG